MIFLSGLLIIQPHPSERAHGETERRRFAAGLVRESVSHRTRTGGHGRGESLRPCLPPSGAPNGHRRVRHVPRREPSRLSIAAIASSATALAERVASTTTNLRDFARRSYVAATLFSNAGSPKRPFACRLLIRSIANSGGMRRRIVRSGRRIHPSLAFWRKRMGSRSVPRRRTPC